MTSLADYRADLADAVHTVLGIHVTHGVLTQPEGGTAHVRQGGSGQFLDANGPGATFCHPTAIHTVVVMAHGVDPGAAHEWLEGHVVTLFTALAGQTLARTGLVAPPPATASEIGPLDDDHTLLAVAVELQPTPIAI